MNNPKKGQYFLSFEDKKQQVIKPTLLWEPQKGKSFPHIHAFDL